MITGILTLFAAMVALGAARVTLRRRVVFLLGRHGHEIAPTVMLSIWLVGLLVGQVTGSVPGMAIVAALVPVAVALFVRRRFAPLAARHRIWTGVDWVVFGYGAVMFGFLERWDFDCHHTVIAKFLQGDIPPTAINDPRFPIAYHAAFDAMAAVIMKALPVELDLGLGIASTICLALTLANLRNVSRLIFRSPRVAALARVLFVFGFGPVVIRFLLEGANNPEAFHGRTTQVFVDVIMRRPTGLGFAFFTLVLALALPCYRATRTQAAPCRAVVARLGFLVPICALLPLIAEELTLTVCLMLAPLVLARRLPARLLLLLVVAAALGASQSGVVRGILHPGPMATPRLHLAWPPALPNWNFSQDGVGLFSRAGLLFFGTELGPVFAAAVVLALASRNGRQRALVGAFACSLAVVLFVKPTGWPKADLDRFLFYATPPVFMLSATLVDRLSRRLPALSRRRPFSAVAVAFAVLVCGPALFWPTWRVGQEVNEAFRRHALGGDLSRHLAAAGPREPILTTASRVDDLVKAGFSVLAPFDTNWVGQYTHDTFDAYVRDNAARAVWLFLPERDPRVVGRTVRGRDGGYVLVAPGPAAPSLAAVH